MLKVSKYTGIIGSLAMLILVVVCSMLHFNEPLFNAALYVGIIGTLLLLIAALAIYNGRTPIKVMLIAGAILIGVSSILLGCGLKGDEKAGVIPLLVGGNFLTVISLFFGLIG